MKKNLFYSYIILLVFGSNACVKTKSVDDNIKISDKKIDFLGITNKDKLSAATLRSLNWTDEQLYNNDWYFEYNVYDLKGDFSYEKGVVRRDPSAIIKHNGVFYCWYSKSIGKTVGFDGNPLVDKVFPWDRCDIWYATSKDGMTWVEQGIAIKRGKPGSYDDRSVFTAEIMEHEGMYYLCYQTVKSPYNKRVKNQIGLSWSSSPEGPWTKSKQPILSPANNGVWEGNDLQDRHSVIKKGDFDSHKVHDPCIIPFNGKFFLYYKGEQMGEAITFGGRQIRHGVAIANHPRGPYIKSPYNPISNSGHEICVWKYNGGIASLITTDGPERNTVQWAKDGINFKIMGAVKGAPHAIGLNRTADNEKEPTEILRWGLTHQYKTYDYQYIRGFNTFVRRQHTAKSDTKNKNK